MGSKARGILSWYRRESLIVWLLTFERCDLLMALSYCWYTKVKADGRSSCAFDISNKELVA
jgi:hypothetical protein